MSQTLTLPYPPLLNRMYRSYGNRVVKSQAAVDYAEIVFFAARAMGAVCYPGNVSVVIDSYRPQKSGDIDAPLKCVLDAMEGCFYENDRQIVDLHIRRHDDKHNPRLEITVTEYVP